MVDTARCGGSHQLDASIDHAKAWPRKGRELQHGACVSALTVVKEVVSQRG